MSEDCIKKVVTLAIMSDQLAMQKDLLDSFFSSPMIDPNDRPIMEHIQDCIVDAATHMDDLVDKYYDKFDVSAKMSGDLLRKYYLQYIEFDD